MNESEFNETKTSAAMPQHEPLFPDLTRDDVFRLETPRLWLRWQRRSDAAALMAFAGQKQVADMTGTWAHPLPEDEPERRIFEARKANATGISLVLAMTARSKPNHQIGQVGVGRSKHAGSKANVEIGYMLHPDYWGQGLVVEAVQAVLNTVFSYTDAQSVGAWTRVINSPSQRVLEKCGFRHAGSSLLDQPARGGMLPCDQYLLDRKTWSALVSWGQSASGRPLPSSPNNVGMSSADNTGTRISAGPDPASIILQER